MNALVYVKKEFWAQLFIPAKPFKIRHIYWKRKPTQFFSFFILNNFELYPINALFYVDIYQGIHKVKWKLARYEKQKTMWVLISNFNNTKLVERSDWTIFTTFTSQLLPNVKSFYSLTCFVRLWVMVKKTKDSKRMKLSKDSCISRMKTFPKSSLDKLQKNLC